MIESVEELKNFKDPNESLAFKCSRCGKVETKKLKKFNNKILCRMCVRRQTNLEKYGVESNFQTGDFKIKARKTNIEKYGTPFPSQNPIVEAKRKKTYIDKYGVSGFFQLPNSQEKIRKAILEKHGVSFNSQRPEVKVKLRGRKRSLESIEKMIATNIEKYGSKSPLQNPKILEKTVATLLEKYGVDNYGESENCKNVGLRNSKKYSDRMKGSWSESGLMRNWFNSLTSEQKMFFREKLSSEMKKQWEEGGSKRNWFNSLTPEQKRDIRRKASCRYEYLGIRFDSSWELAYYVWLRDHNIDFEYQCEPIEYQDLDGTKHLYFPDFKIDGQYVEIKGPHFFTESGQFINPFDRSEKMNEHNSSKYKCMLENNVIVKTDVTEQIQYVKELYGSDFFEECKILS